MSNINFSKNTNTPVLDVEAEVKPGTPVNIDKAFAASPGVESTTQSQLPATLGSGVSEFAGDYLPGFADVILPHINIVQSVGGLKDTFTPGEIVYGQNLVLYSPPIIDKKTGNSTKAGLPPVEITILGFRPTRFVEKLAGGARGMLVNTEAEVRAAGGTIDFNEHKLKAASGMKLFQTLAEAFIIIKRPAHVADDDSVFIFPAGNDKYALALWSLKGSAYTQCAKRSLFTARKMGCLQRGGYPSWSFNLTTRSETYAGNTYFIPVCVPNAPTTPLVAEFVKSALRPKAETDAATA